MKGTASDKEKLVFMRLSFSKQRYKPPEPDDFEAFSKLKDNEKPLNDIINRMKTQTSPAELWSNWKGTLNKKEIAAMNSRRKPPAVNMKRHRVTKRQKVEEREV